MCLEPTTGSGYQQDYNTLRRGRLVIGYTTRPARPDVAQGLTVRYVGIRWLLRLLGSVPLVLSPLR
jgi:hypothetical protein